MLAYSRSQRILSRFDGRFDALLVSNPVNVRYLLEQPEIVGGAYLLSHDYRVAVVDRRSAPPETPLLQIDQREAPDLDSIRQAVRDYEGRLGFDDDHLTVREFAAVRELVGASVALIPAGGAVEMARAVKEPEEISRMAAAARITDAVLHHLADWCWVGKSERDVALEAEITMKRLGADGPAFPTLVARAPGSAMVHREAGHSRIASGDLVLVDLGARLGGYASDCTRMFSVGPASAEFLEVYAVLLDAQERGLEAVGPDIDVRVVDAAARGRIGAAGYGEYFGHGLGHGVGITIHEAPRLSPHVASRALAEGNVVTVEPGIYIPGRFGMRIEDLVVVTEDGCSILSEFPKLAPTIVS